MSSEFSLPIRVYIEDTDAGGIVYYVNYLKFIERARTEWLRELGFDKAGANKESHQFVVRSVSVEYLRPAKLDDMLRIDTQAISLSGARLSLRQSVWRDEQKLAQAEVQLACVSGATLRPQRIPEEMRQRLHTIISL